MFYLKTPCGCITLCDDTVDLTKPETTGLGHEMVVYGCTTEHETFRNSRNMPEMPAPKAFIARCKKIFPHSLEGLKITKLINDLIQRGKQAKNAEEDEEVEEVEGMRLLGRTLGENPFDDLSNFLEDKGVQVIKIPNYGNPLVDFLNSLVELLEPPALTRLTSLTDIIPEFPSTGDLTIDEFIEALELRKTCTPGEVMALKSYMQIAQRLAAIPNRTIAMEDLLESLKKKCCNLVMKGIDSLPGEIGDLLGRLQR